MLSNDAYKLLKWLEKHDRWMTREEIEKDSDAFNERSFKVITTEKLIENRLAEDGENWVEYRISDTGKAYLEGARYTRLADIREWMSFGLSVAAIVISIIALLMQ